MVAGARREFAVAHGAQLPAERLLGDSDAELLKDPLRQIDQPPAHNAVDRRERTILNDLRDNLALGVIELGGLTRRLAVQETNWPARVEPQYPVPDDLKPNATNLRRLGAHCTVIDRCKSQKPTGLRTILRLLRQPTQPRRVEILSKRYRHDEPPAFAMLNLTCHGLGIAGELRFQGLGITYSRDALAQVLTMVADMPNVGEVGLIGHSMGAWLTVEALRQLRLTGKNRVIRRLHHVALVSPDIDVNVFRSQMAVIGRLDPPMKLLVSKDDQALSISALLAGSAGRVGNLDVDDPTVQALAAARNIQIIDISKIPSTDYMNYDRFIGVSTMLTEIARSGRDSGVGNPAERAGAFVLDLAGAIVASPFKIVRGALPN